jgi:ribosomal protein S18 acetylase RimI-like enzyme
MEKLSIRTYRPEDHDVVVLLHEVAMKDTNAFSDNPIFEEDFKDLEGVYLKSGGEFLVGIIDGEIVAMGAFRKISEEVAEIKRMRVHPKYQRRGLGQQIYNELETRAKKKGFKKLILDSSVPQTAALNFYAKNGFTETHRKNLHGIYMIFFEKNLA